MKKKDQTIAKESNRTKVIREKLEKKSLDEKAQLTPQALKEMAQKINQWITDHAQNRVPIGEFGPLFKGNKGSAPVSKKVEAFAKKVLSALESKDVAI